MFGRPFKVGRLFGIAITINPALALLMIFLSVRAAFYSESFLLGLLLGAVVFVLVFASILAHELGHSLVARRLGVQVSEIELHFFGGAAKMTSAPKTPRDELLIAAAGPATSFVLALLFGVGWVIIPEPTGLVGFLAYANLLLGAFNLVPALPMDGGRILRAALTPRYGALQATRISVKVARVLVVVGGVAALASGRFFLAALAVVVWILGSRELKMAEWMARQQQVEVYDRDGRPVADAGPVWWEAPSTMSTENLPSQVVVVRGPDGRLWVVTRR